MGFDNVSGDRQSQDTCKPLVAVRSVQSSEVNNSVLSESNLLQFSLSRCSGKRS